MRSLCRVARVVSAGLLAVGVAGCGRKTDAPPPPRVGWVRLDPLAARHPLTAEVERLRRAEAEFSRLDTAGVLGGENGAQAKLPALPILGPVPENRALALRRAAQRRRLQQAKVQGLQNFAQGRLARQERVIEQRRVELDATYRARDADRERQARLDVEAATARRLGELAQEKLVYEARVAVLDGQLKQESLTVGPVRREDLEQEIARLRADPNAEGISPRAHLTLRLERELASLTSVRRLITQVTEQGQQRVASLAAEAQTRREQEIEAALRGLREDAALDEIAASQQEALRKALAAEARSARLERQVMDAAGTGNQQGAGALDFDSASAQSGASGLQTAALRIRRQRENLQRYIRESVAEAVRDTAHQQNITVTLVPDSTAPGRPAGADLTGEFLRWIRWAEPLPGRQSPPRAGAVGEHLRIKSVQGKDMRA